MVSWGDSRELRAEWELGFSPAGQTAGPDGVLVWSFKGIVPGTIAKALDSPDSPGGGGLAVEADLADWWYRTSFEAGADETLVLDGVATVADVFLNGELVAHNESMFAPIRIDLAGRLQNRNELAICCRGLAPRLQERRKPRARWRTALVTDGNLRFFRTMLLGRAPGFAPGPPVVGIWRPVRLETPAQFGEVRLRTRIEGDDGVLAIRVQGGAGAAVEVSGPTGMHDGALEVAGPEAGHDTCAAEIRIPGVARWWPHTHGDPALYEVRIAERVVGRVGFRTLQWPADWEERGLSLKLNGVAVFARGAVWTPLELRSPHQEEGPLRAALEAVAAAGMNMVRVPGTACYESDTFHDLCDELGILVWQDFMLANLDYPDADPEFMAELEAEARRELGRIAGRPSLAVVCGGSEVAQQVTMLGLDPALAQSPIYTKLLPELVAESEAGVPYVPNAPWGGELPFRPNRGVANYYGVGGYRRDLSDARLADVRFAAECLAFSNVPDESALAEIEAAGGLVPHHPAWKSGIPRDAGTGWDFEDVRDHYLRLLYGEDAVAARSVDVARYLELSRSVSGEVMAEVFGEWRRAGSSCAGGLILWLRDLQPGAGWGIVDHRGQPKVAYHHLRRVLAPVAVWITDEGLSGMVAHVANDRPVPLDATLRVALYRDGEVRVEQAAASVRLDPHRSVEFNLETVIGRFVDISWAYRFGAPNHDLVVATLELGPEPGAGLISQAFRFPVGRPRRRERADQLGLEAELDPGADGRLTLRLHSRRLVHGVRVEAPGLAPADNAFSLEPGVGRQLRLSPTDDAPDGRFSVTVTALNLLDRLRVGSAETGRAESVAG